MEILTAERVAELTPAAGGSPAVIQAQIARQLLEARQTMVQPEDVNERIVEFLRS